MSIQGFFEDFALDTVSEKQKVPAENKDDVHLANYEEGYKAGWDDALKAKQDEEDTFLDNLKSNLLDLSFTYQEALGFASKQACGLVEEVLRKVSPEIEKSLFVKGISESIKSHSKQLTSQGMEISVSPDNVELVRSMIGIDGKSNIRVSSDDRMNSSEASITVGAQEAFVETGEILSEIETLLKDFWDETDADARKVGRRWNA